MPTIKSNTDDNLTERLELYRLLREGLEDVEAGHTRPFDDAIEALISKYSV